MIVQGKILHEVVAPVVFKGPKPPKPPKRIWDNYMVIGDVLKSEQLKLQVAAATRDGVRYINIREFYWAKNVGEWKPGRDGIVIPVVVPLKGGTEIITPYAKLEELLQVTIEVLKTLPLADKEHAVYKEVKKK